ncbi:hypothetical protein Sjap_013018 [Stephania japonica]|uniref:YTH domain-containing family protein n=1 Tax=Stephania japonica TaxID=461633 RepID=A0AAP0P0X9_9MAGN
MHLRYRIDGVSLGFRRIWIGGDSAVGKSGDWGLCEWSDWEAAGLLKNLSIDSEKKPLEVSEPVKKSCTIQRGAVEGVAGNGPFQPLHRSTPPPPPPPPPPLLQEFVDPTMCYFPEGYPTTAFYYGGYDVPSNEWDDYRYITPDGVEMPTGVYGDNGSVVYHSYGYPPYGAYAPTTSPVPTIAHDGQLYGPQHYQYPFYQTQTNGSFAANQPSVSQEEVTASLAADKGPLSGGMPKGNGTGKVGGNSNGLVLKPTQPNSRLNVNGSYGRGAMPGGIPASSPQEVRFGFDGARSLVPWLDGSGFPNGKPRPTTSSSSSSIAHFQPGMNQTIRSLPTMMQGFQAPRPTSGLGSAGGLVNRMYPNNRIYNQSGSTTRTGNAYGSNGLNTRTNGRGLFSVDGKYKPKGRSNGFFGYGNENMDGLSELNIGPRARASKNQKVFAPVTLAVKGQIISLNAKDEEKDVNNIKSIVPDREQYNREDFAVNYTNAKFFIIKSYSEDDIHKSIKYSVWASTPNGNKKLDDGYQEAQEKSGGCPVFLFFSVNTSGQFVGLAEMVGPVDFNKNVEYWQQDKWNGCFPLKWHIVKDVPNNMLKHIILENNENKPVTNSRDTQEVKLEQGLQMLKIFKEHSSKTCILDDFGFYEARQKLLQEKRIKQQFQKQARHNSSSLYLHVWDGKVSDTSVTEDKGKEGTVGKLGRHKSLDSESSLKEPMLAQANGEQKPQFGKIELANGSAISPKCGKSVEVTVNRAVVNGHANGF